MYKLKETKRMTNKDVVNSFYKGNVNESASMHSNGTVLFSYSTAIAQRVNIDDKTVIIKNVTRYSNTTSKHQALVDKFDYAVSDIPKGENNLIKYM